MQTSPRWVNVAAALGLPSLLNYDVFPLSIIMTKRCLCGAGGHNNSKYVHSKLMTSIFTRAPGDGPPRRLLSGTGICLELS